MAYFRGHARVEIDDVRQIVPWVLHDKLVPNTRSPYFEPNERGWLLQDRVAWIRTMIDTSIEQFERHAPIRERVRAARAELDQGLEGVDLRTVEKRIGKVTGAMRSLFGKAELSGPIYEDLIHLKSIYSRYRNYAAWLRSHSGGS